MEFGRKGEGLGLRVKKGLGLLRKEGLEWRPLSNPSYTAPC